MLASLTLHYDVTLDEAAPDLVFCGDEHGDGPSRFPEALRILLLFENRYADFSRYHYAIGLRTLDHPRWFRQPLYVRTSKAEELVKPSDFVERTFPLKTKFCTLLAANANPVRVWRRLAVADKLDRYKPVDFGGPYRNNVGAVVPYERKVEFYSSYRFAIAFENGGMRGHVTEKITDAMKAGCIPIFWGNPDIAEEFNPRSFINAHEFRSLDALVDRVREIDGSEGLYRQYLSEPYFHGNAPNEHFDPRRLGEFLWRAVESPRPTLYPVYPPYRWHDWTRKIGFVADWAAGKIGVGMAGPT